MAKKMYHVHENVQDRDFFVLASNKAEAQRMILEEHTEFHDYETDDYDFEFVKYVCFEVKAKAIIEKV